MVRLVLHGLGQPGMGLLSSVCSGWSYCSVGSVDRSGRPCSFGTPPARQNATGRCMAGQDGRGVNGGSVLTGSPKSTLGPRCDHR